MYVGTSLEEIINHVINRLRRRLEAVQMQKALAGPFEIRFHSCDK